MSGFWSNAMVSNNKLENGEGGRAAGLELAIFRNEEIKELKNKERNKRKDGPLRAKLWWEGEEQEGLPACCWQFSRRGRRGRVCRQIASTFRSRWWHTFGSSDYMIAVMHVIALGV